MKQSLSSEFNSLVPAIRLNRREFVVTALAGGFALAVQPVCAQTTISTDTQGLIAGEVDIPVTDGSIPAYRAMPAHQKNLPTILVVEEIFGVHEHIKDICRRLAKLGYLAIAPELFWRQGDVSKLSNITEIISNVVSKVPDAQTMTDLDATAKWAAHHGGNPARVGITGFCWGGRIVWLYATHNPRLKAGVAWYGRLAGTPTALQPRYPIDRVELLHAPVLGLYGGQDKGIPLSDVKAMQEAIKRVDADAEIHVYDDVGHAFNADYRPSYRKDAAEDGWQRMRRWFTTHGL